MKPLAATYVQNGNIVFITRPHGYKLTEDIYNGLMQSRSSWICLWKFGPCQHDPQPRQDTEFIIEDLPGQFPDINIPDELEAMTGVSFQLVCFMYDIIYTLESLVYCLQVLTKIYNKYLKLKVLVVT